MITLPFSFLKVRKNWWEMKLVGRLPCAIFVRKINILKRWSGVTTIRNPSLDIKCTKKVVSANPKTGSCCLQNRFLPIPKPVFADLETGFFRLHKQFFPIQHRLLPTPKLFFTDFKTGFSRLQNRFLTTPKLFSADPKPGFVDFKTGFCRLQNRHLLTPKPVVPIWNAVFANSKTGFEDS